MGDLAVRDDSTLGEGDGHTIDLEGGCFVLDLEVCNGDLIGIGGDTPDIAAAGNLYKAMFGIGVPFADGNALFLLSGCAILLIVCCVGATEGPKKLALKLEERMPARAYRPLRAAVLLAILFVSLSFLVADSYNPFLYFRF